MATKNLAKQCTITPELKKQVIGMLNEIRKKLYSGIKLTSLERRMLPGMGRQRAAYVKKMITIIKKEPGLFGTEIDIAELERCYSIYCDINDIIAALKKLQKQVSDLSIHAGSDAYKLANLAGKILKNSTDPKAKKYKTAIAKQLRSR